MSRNHNHKQDTSAEKEKNVAVNKEATTAEETQETESTQTDATEETATTETSDDASAGTTPPKDSDVLHETAVKVEPKPEELGTPAFPAKNEEDAPVPDHTDQSEAIAKAEAKEEKITTFSVPFEGTEARLHIDGNEPKRIEQKPVKSIVYTRDHCFRVTDIEGTVYNLSPNEFNILVRNA